MATLNKNEKIIEMDNVIGYEGARDVAFFLSKLYVFKMCKLIIANIEQINIIIEIDNVNLGNLADIKK